MVDWILLVLPGLIWGASFLFIAEGLDALRPNGVTFARIAIGFATLSVIPAARRPIRRSDWWPCAALGVLWLAFPLSMFPFAEQRVSSALTGMLNGATPLFTATVASLVARQLPGRATLVGLAVGFTGTVVMALPGLSTGTASSQQAVGVCLILAPLGVPAFMDAHWSARSVAALLALGAFGTAIAHVIAATTAGRLGATRASATTFLMPVGRRSASDHHRQFFIRDERAVVRAAA
jgi:drug/metabolite transporter (DMT)-like permease